MRVLFFDIEDLSTDVLNVVNTILTVTYDILGEVWPSLTITADIIDPNPFCDPLIVTANIEDAWGSLIIKADIIPSLSTEYKKKKQQPTMELTF